MREAPYRILGISSGRTMGNAEIVLRESLMECEKIAPCDVRIVRLRTLKMATCDGCMECMKDAANGGNGECLKEDDFQWLKEQILWADAIIFSDPCFCYMPTAEVITMMNRALGSGRDYVKACRANPKYVGLITVGGSDTVDFSLPMQYAALNAACRGFELVDMFYANWVRGKGFVALQKRHMERARLHGKRIMYKLMGYPVKPPHARIEKLNPLENTDDIFVELDACPACHSAVVHMDPSPFKNGQFQCSICGATGHLEHHGGQMTYAWDDDAVAHNYLHEEHDAVYIEKFVAAHKETDKEKQTLPEFPILSPGNDPVASKPRITAVVAGSPNGTSELLARKALAEATADGKYEGAIIRINELNIHFCTGCLICKINERYRGGEDICILKDDDLWLVDKLIYSAGAILSIDGINGYTYSNFISALERFGHFTITKNPALVPTPFALMVSAFDEQVKTPVFAGLFFARHQLPRGPEVARELLPNVPLIGDGILADDKALSKAGALGKKVAHAAGQVLANPAAAFMMPRVQGMCPSCGLNMIEIRTDMTAACAHCDAQGKFERRFGENLIVWDDFDVTHSRATFYGAMLHTIHIGFSQEDDRDVLDNPKLLADVLAPYNAYGKLVRPERKKK